MLLSMMVVSLVAGRVTTNTGKYKVFPLVGSVLMVAGLFLLAQMDTETTRLTSGLYMAVLGAGMGCLMQITMLVAQNSVEMKDMGVASSSTTLFRTLGSSFGVAIMGALFNNRVQDVMAERAGATGGKVAEHSTQLTAEGLAKLPDVVRDAYLHAVSAGTHSAFLLGSVIAVLALIAAVFVKEVPLRGAGPAKEAPSSPEAAGPADAQPVDMAKAGTATADAKPVEGARPGTPRRTAGRSPRPSERVVPILLGLMKAPGALMCTGGLRRAGGCGLLERGRCQWGVPASMAWRNCGSCGSPRTRWTATGPRRTSTWTRWRRMPAIRATTSCGASRRRTGRRPGSI